MTRGGEAVGALAVTGREPGSYSNRQIELLKTFADQAIIAIENVRLFTELQEKNRALTEALDQQTATSEILRVISGSPTNVQPVFDTIAASARRLLDGFSSLARTIRERTHRRPRRLQWARNWTFTAGNDGAGPRSCARAPGGRP